MPTTSQPRLRPASTTARITALSPGASPPPVDTAMRLIGRDASPAIRRSVGRPAIRVAAVPSRLQFAVAWRADHADDRHMFDRRRVPRPVPASRSTRASPGLAVRDVVQRAVAAPAAMSRRVAAGASRDHAAPPRRRPHRAARRVGAGDVDLPARPPDVGGDRHLRGPGGQRLLPALGAGCADAHGVRRQATVTSATSLVLGDDTIHGVTNPLDHLTAAIHVYGGDLVDQPRSQWGPGERIERPYDLAEAQAAVRRRQRRLARRVLAPRRVSGGSPRRRARRRGR